MQNVVRSYTMKTLKKTAILGLLLIGLIGCQEQVDDWTPITIYDVKFSPASVHPGDELTITFAYSDPNNDFSASKVSIDGDGNISYRKSSETSTEYISNNFVSFGIDCSDDDNFDIRREGGHEYVEIRSERTNIHPSKYTYFEDGKVKCIVPNNAKSGYINLYMYSGLTYYGHSLKKLIVE